MEFSPSCRNLILVSSFFRFSFVRAAESWLWPHLFFAPLARLRFCLSFVAASFRKAVPQWRPDPDVEYIHRLDVPSTNSLLWLSNFQVYALPVIR
jgi:hypothetical protein